MTLEEKEEFEAIVEQFEEASKDAQNTITALEAEKTALQDELAATQNQPPTGGALCGGCYKWRMAAAAVVGLGCGLFAAAHLQSEQPELLRRAALSLTGHANAASPVLALFVLVTTVAPVLVVVGEYKVLRYKHGLPGVLRATVEIWCSLKAAFIRGIK